MKRALLLCTDLDRTLVPNGAEPEAPGVRALFAEVASQPEVTLVYVTGRDLGRVESAIAEWKLPDPDLVIADVGTSVYASQNAEWIRWSEWDHLIAPAWAGRRQPGVADLLDGVDHIRAQEADRQGPWKLSYYVATDADRDAVDAEVRARLAPAGVDAHLIWSVDEAADVGLLDIVPRGASKLHALTFVTARLDFRREDVLFAGDSGNDLELLVSPTPSVLVANARADVRERAVSGATQAGVRDTLYLARGGWRGMNGYYAAGILEGLAHFRPDCLERIL